MAIQNTSNADTGAQRLAVLLNSRPPKRAAFIYQAVILSLAAHIFVLAVMYLATASPAQQAEEKTEVVEELELKFEEETPEETNPVDGNMSETVRNLLANSQSQRTNEQVNYTGKSKEQIEAEVWQKLKGEEQAEMDRLRSGHQDMSVPDPQKQNNKGQDKQNTSKDNYDWYKNQSEKSYNGPVSAEYFLKDRTAKSSPKPTYRCKSSGQIVVKITVDPTGAVVEAEVDDSKSKGGDCIREESLSYARRWKFDYKDAAPKKQQGTITFTFSAQ